jgi:hypothetical protein
MTKDEALNMAIEALEDFSTQYARLEPIINACKEALEPEPMTTTDVITCKMVGKCCMTGEALEQPSQGIELEWYVKGWDDALKDKNSV